MRSTWTNSHIYSTSRSCSRYERYHERFLGVFPAPKDKVYYAAGNHDVGYAIFPTTSFLDCGLAPPSLCSLGSSGGFSESAVERYVSHFGPLNRVVQITAKHRLVIVDAPSLVDEDEERIKHGVPIRGWPSVGGPVEFINELSKAPGEASERR